MSGLVPCSLSLQASQKELEMVLSVAGALWHAPKTAVTFQPVGCIGDASEILELCCRNGWT